VEQFGKMSEREVARAKLAFTVDSQSKATKEILHTRRHRRILDKYPSLYCCSSVCCTLYEVGESNAKEGRVTEVLSAILLEK
jgi:hypothetical protein